MVLILTKVAAMSRSRSRSLHLNSGSIVLVSSSTKDNQDQDHRDQELDTKGLVGGVLRVAGVAGGHGTCPGEIPWETTVVPRPSRPRTLEGTTSWSRKEQHEIGAKTAVGSDEE